MAAVPFEVEQVLELPGRPPVILARALTGEDFVVSEGSRLGGCPVSPTLTQPRAKHDDGTPRFDLYAFALQRGKDAAHFSATQRVLLGG